MSKLKVIGTDNGQMVQMDTMMMMELIGVLGYGNGEEHFLMVEDIKMTSRFISQNLDMVGQDLMIVHGKMLVKQQLKDVLKF